MKKYPQLLTIHQEQAFQKQRQVSPTPQRPFPLARAGAPGNRTRPGIGITSLLKKRNPSK